jgi:hypothetical protein
MDQPNLYSVDEKVNRRQNIFLKFNCRFILLLYTIVRMSYTIVDDLTIFKSLKNLSIPTEL